ncbi:hypothetical protein EIN_002120 [Entamoeba invadens IP1]|uniref:J domain-containing protein n=1 Tax=Entamoeba invadens IP1 TaxID=370355 RepID=L7FJ22_ENTIV|nr:hypothetical protein EIN_002120 [Entamoeba invadens IP1]ELP83561.1 hypothetical protein EIN_002120 [Entamoeba invadens IP1]|eukprot:XP_004182907.1 hypothetical protein EIN_002120 [Entamoeba invadens IP1]
MDSDTQFEFDDQMSLVFISSLLCIGLLLLLLIFLRRRYRTTPSFPCECSLCCEKHFRSSLRRKKYTKLDVILLFLIVLFSSLFAFNVLYISRAEVPSPPEKFDPYHILSVTRGSSEKDIRAAYRRLSLKYHPDKNKLESAKENFILVTRAYEVLTTPSKLRAWEETGRDEEDHGVTFGIGMPSFLNGRKNKTFVLAFYGIVVVLLIPLGVFLLYSKCGGKSRGRAEYATNAAVSRIMREQMTLMKVVELLSFSTEFADLEIEQRDTTDLPLLVQKIKSQFRVEQKDFLPVPMKIQTLIGAHLSRLHNEMPQYLRDELDYIIEKAPNVLNKLVYIMISKGNMEGVWSTLKVNQMITQATDNENEQIPDIDNNKENTTDIFKFEEFVQLSENERTAFVQKNYKINYKLPVNYSLKFFRYFPSSVEFVVQAMSATMNQKVARGVPLMVLINAYRYPRENTGELSGRFKDKFSNIFESEGGERENQNEDVDDQQKINEHNEKVFFDDNKHEIKEDVYVHNPLCPNERLERWWYILTDASDSYVITATCGFIQISDRPTVIKIYAKNPNGVGKYHVNLHCICDAYINCEKTFHLDFDVVERTFEDENEVSDASEEEMNGEEQKSDNEENERESVTNEEN